MIRRKWFAIAVFSLAGTASILSLVGSPTRDWRFEGIWGPRYDETRRNQISKRHPFRRGQGIVHRLRHWNEVAIDASGLDHTPVQASENRVFGEQVGPGRSSRAMAIVHIAVFDAANAIDNEFESFTGIPQVREATSMDSAIAQAAHDTLVAMFPSQARTFDQRLAEDLDDIHGGRAKDNGIDLGRRAAARILALRRNDGAQEPELRVNVDHIPSNQPDKWRQDPISLHPLALGAKWGEVTPFVMREPEQFRVAAPPPINSQAYADAYYEVKRLGGDGITTSTVRTPYETTTGIFWAYDGTPSLCAPPRLYNQLALTIADAENTNDPVNLARLLALVNTAMADAGIAIWESKYFYNYWRPVTGIREADPGTGPTGAGDGNADTTGDAAFSPLGAPASNLTGPNFTPPFPAYPSGHAGFGGALFQTLRRFYGTDYIRFSFVSDEFNGETVGNDGVARPVVRRTYSRLSQAEEENGQSRIYLGIHWAFDKTEGIDQGRRVADYVFEHAFKRRRGRER